MTKGEFEAFHSLFTLRLFYMMMFSYRVVTLKVCSFYSTLSIRMFSTLSIEALYLMLFISCVHSDGREVRHRDVCQFEGVNIPVPGTRLPHDDLGLFEQESIGSFRTCG